MKKYILRRLVLSIIVLFGVVTITFFMTRILPADPAQKWAGPRATADQVAQARIELNLDRPIIVQYGYYISDLVHGDLGVSYVDKRPVAKALGETIPATIELVLFATIFAIPFGIILGVGAARYKNRAADHLIRILSIGEISLPSFWFALALQLIFYGGLALLPFGGRVDSTTSVMYEMPHITGMLLLDSALTGKWFIFKDALYHIILPSIPLMLYPTGLVSRMTRSGLLEIMNEDYITAERSYGISDRFVLWVYAFKNSLGPTTTVVALAIGWELTNTFLVEAIYSWPGIGKYVANSVVALDYPAIMGVTIFSAIVYMLLNLVADLIIASDPRIRV